MFTLEEQKEIQLFLALLFPWTSAEKDLWKSVSWTFVGEEGGLKFAGYAAQSLDDLCRLISTRASRPSSNVYVALGAQRMATQEKKTVDGFPRASRVLKNIVSVKSLYLDVDVGKEGAYATTADAKAAVADMCAVLKLPEPTMLVESGSGGLHVYWVFDASVPLNEWQPLAKALQAAALNYGLKFDPQVTVDACRILRVPNTYNHKTVPPAKVRLVREEGHGFPRYGYAQMAAALAQWTNGRPDVRAANATNQQRTRNDDLTGGVTEATAAPVSIDDVAANCMTIDDILTRGGNGDAEPLWNLSLLAASFTTDPHDAAHRLGNQDPRYSSDGTEKKLAEKIQARAANSKLGWPTCQQFSALSPACRTCPLLVQQKSPLYHARRYTPPPADPATRYVPSGDDKIMPAGYWRNKDGVVYTMITGKDGLQYTVPITPGYAIHDAGIDGISGDLRMEVTISGVKRWLQVDVSANMQPGLLAAALSTNNGMFLPPRNHAAARDFFVAWVSHLQNLKRYTGQSAYGWSSDGKSFAYDNQIFHADGTVETVYRGKNHNSAFMVAGELKPWQDAMRLVYGNMPLEIVVATAFAAPLVELISHYSLIVSLFSRASGIGKSTAMALAQSVWGHPVAGMNAYFDTNAAMIGKLGSLKNLPSYWDELHSSKDLEKVVDIVFSITQGKGKSRMRRDTSLADVTTFRTLFCIASNHGIGDAVYSQTESTEAGGLRIFEIEAQPMTATVAGYTAQQLMIPLQTNFGAAGAAYGKWLAQNRAAIAGLLAHLGKELDEKYSFDAKERYWAMTMRAIIAGATAANACQLAKFDVAGIRKYLDGVLADQRGEMQTQNYSTMSGTQDVVALLHEMLSSARNKSLIITETIPYSTMGRPALVPLVDTDMSKVNDPWLWMGRKDGRVRARVRPFNEYLRERRYNPRQIVEALKGHYHVNQSKQTIGAGVQGLDALASFGRYSCYDFTPLTSPAPSPGSDEPK